MKLKFSIFAIAIAACNLTHSEPISYSLTTQEYELLKLIVEMSKDPTIGGGSNGDIVVIRKNILEPAMEEAISVTRALYQTSLENLVLQKELGELRESKSCTRL